MLGNGIILNEKDRTTLVYTQYTTITRRSMKNNFMDMKSISYDFIGGNIVLILS